MRNRPYQNQSLPHPERKANRQNKEVSNGSVIATHTALGYRFARYRHHHLQSAFALFINTPRRRCHGPIGRIENRPKHHSVGLHSGSRHRIPNGAGSHKKWAMMQECAVRKLAASTADQWISRPTSVERLDRHPLLRIECAKHKAIEA